MKKLLLITTLILMAVLTALSQSTNSKISNSIDDSSLPGNSQQLILQGNNSKVKNTTQSKLVPLQPDISFDEFPVNHNMHIATDGTYYYTINGGNAAIGQINQFDLTGVLIQTYPIQIDGRGLSYNKADGFLYASLYARDIVRIDNLAAGTWTTIFSPGMQNDQASFAISNDGTKYYDFYAGTLLVHDFFTGTVINTITGLSYGPGNFGGEEAVAVDSLYIYTWDATIKTVSQYDLTGTLMQTLVLDSGENGHSISRAGNYLFVAHDGNYAMGRWYGYLVDSTNSLSVTNTCYGDSTAFAVSSSTNLLGAQWDFGDPASGINNTAYTLNPVHSFTMPGPYTVQVIKFFTSYTDTSYINVTISASPVINLGADTSFCTGSTYIINAGSGYTSYLWQDGSTDSTFTAAVADTFYVTVFNGSCAATDTIILTENPCNTPGVNFFCTDTSFCEKLCIDFTDLSTNNPTSWQWFFPGSDSLTSTQQNPSGICYNSYGSFDVTLIACNVNGCDTLFLPGFINEYQTPVPTITQSNDTLYSSPGVSYQWWSVGTGIISGATNSWYLPTTGGSYFVIVTDTVGCAGVSNTIVVNFAGIDQFAVGSLQLAINPNPNNGNFTVSMNESVKDFSLRIFNPLGQIVYQMQDAKDNLHGAIEINLTNVATGIYTAELVTNEKVFRQQFVIN